MAGPKFLNFDQAVELSELLVDYSNSTQGRQAFEIISEQTGLKVKDSYIVNINKYERNCEDCMGCSDEGCILGCFKTPSFHICYWDKALEKIIGTKLVTHEFGHVWFEQVFDTKNMNKDEFFNESEQFAQYIEDNFTENIVWCAECKQFEVLIEFDQNLTISEGRDRIVDGILFGLGLSASAALVYWLIARARKNKNLVQ